jgi:hypothetical protein
MSFGAFCLLDFACSLVATDGTIRKSRKNDESLQPKAKNGMQGFWCRLYELLPLYQYVCNHFFANDYVAKVRTIF